MLDVDIIRPSTSAIASPITITSKADGSLRFCPDFRLVNKHAGIFPYIYDIINDTGGSNTLSTMDLCKGLLQVPIIEETKKYTVFVMPFSLFEYNQSSFGWSSWYTWFQEMMTMVLEPFFGKFARVFIDDIFTYSRDRQEYLPHLSQIQDALIKADLKIKLKNRVSSSKVRWSFSAAYLLERQRQQGKTQSRRPKTCTDGVTFIL